MMQVGRLRAPSRRGLLRGLRSCLIFLLAARAGAVPPSDQPRDTFTLDGVLPSPITVLCQGCPLFRLRGEKGEQRAQQVVAKLRRAFFNAETLPPVVSLTHERFPRLLVAGVPVVTVEHRDARRNHTSPASLAALWARNLQTAFTRWEHRPFPGRLLVPLGGSLSWRVPPRVAGAPVDNTTPAIASLETTPDTVTITGLRGGRTRITFHLPTAVATTQVIVLPWAAQVSGSARVQFSSRQLPPSLRRAALQAAAWSVLRPRPGVVVSAQPADAASSSVVQLTATSPTALDFAAAVPVDVGVRPLLIQRCGELLVSNNPERVNRTGVLLSHGITGTVRLLYHHLNDTRRPLTLLVELLNAGQSPRQVGVVPAAAGPASDEMHVGHQAARTFLRRRSRGDGFVLTLPPRACVPVVVSGFGRHAIVSGLLELLPDTPEGGLFVRVRADETPATTVAGDTISNTHGVSFPTPDIRAGLSYRVGGPWTFFTLGRKGIESRSGTHKLAGNYGVLYDLTLRAENPTDESQAVKLLFAPAGGVARGTFIVAGRHLEAPLTRSGSESLLTVFTLRPHSLRTLRIITMPESASNYPVRLIVRTD